jgi:acetate kinase
VISSDSSRVTVRVIRSDEEVIIAKAAFRELADQRHHGRFQFSSSDA